MQQGGCAPSPRKLSDDAPGTSGPGRAGRTCRRSHSSSGRPPSLVRVNRAFSLTLERIRAIDRVVIGGTGLLRSHPQSAHGTMRLPRVLS